MNASLALHPGETMPKRRRKPYLVVNREERVQATPETKAKARGCIIRKLYLANLIDGQEQDAALQIIEAFTLITQRVGIRPMALDALPAGMGDYGKKAEALTQQYFAWARKVLARNIRACVVVEWLLMERSLSDRDEVSLLIGSLRDWSACRT